MAFLTLSGKGWGWILLNLIRGINVLVFLTIAISAAVLMVVAKMPDAYTFFNDITLAFIITVCFFLGLSEIGVWSGWFARNWPAFGPDRGLTYLGLSMLMLGSQTLGRLSESRGDKKNGLSQIFQSICMAGGILALIFGFVNIFTSWWFGKRLGRNVRDFRRDGAATGPEEDKYAASTTTDGSHYSRSKRESVLPFAKSSKTPSPSRPVISGPIHAEPFEKPHFSPVNPAVARPDSALHPARKNRNTTYSVATGYI